MKARRGGEQLSGRVRDVTHRGEAVVETERGIVLAHGALPGEEVRLELSGRAGGVLRGVLLERLGSSPDRVPPPCPLAATCGGCPLMTLAAAAQLAWKRERLRRALEPHAKDLVPELVESPHATGYRARARLAWAPVPGGTTLGYHAFGSAQLVDVAQCLVLAPALARGLSALRHHLLPHLTGRGELSLGIGTGERCVAELTSQEPQPEAAYAAARALTEDPALAGVALRVAKGAPATFGDSRQLTLGLDGKPLWGPPGAFRQANAEVNARLVARVVELVFEPSLEAGRVLELYAGHGNFTVALAARAKDLRAVESDLEAAEACRANLRERGLPQAKVTCATAEQGTRGKGSFDAVVLDPPRAGAREVLPALLDRRPERIVYVSCDLATLRRDLRTLCEGGYELDAASGFDMFPQTAHLESVVRLRRALRRAR